MGIKLVYAGRNVSCYYQDRLQDFAEIAMSPRLLAICLEVATEEAVPIAISVSPVDEGTYIRSWKVYPTTAVVAGMRRMGAKLINTAPHAALVEWGGRKGGPRRKHGQHVLLHVRDILTSSGAYTGATDPDLMG